MDFQHILERWFLAVTVILCLVLAIVFGFVQTGL